MNAIDELLDLPRLGAWMEAQGLPGGPITDIVSLSGGSQNAVLKLTKGGRDFVLRRPPRHPRAESNETMRREARMLGALAHTGVPHPGLIAACTDETVLGVVFYLMEPVDGFSATTGRLPSPHADDPKLRHRMGLALVDGAAALGRVDYRAVGLGDFGKPEGYLERQAPRWQSLLESYRRYEGWPGPQSLPDSETIASFLASNLPKTSTPGIVHGDYSIGNVLFRRDGPELAAIIDWELTTVGDPLIDLGWILATWRSEEEGDIGVLKVEPFDGFPRPAEIIERYGQQTTRDLSAIDWYTVLACFKLAIVIEGTFARAHAGLAPMDMGVRLHGAATQLFRRALRHIG